MKKIKLVISIFIVVLFISINFISCKKETLNSGETSLTEPNLPQTTYDYVSKHGVDNNLATLGRVLFYDKNLSANNSISCGSCHKQEFAFADNTKFNKGANGLNLTRNSPSIQGIQGFLTKSSFNNDEKGIPSQDNQQKQILFWDGRQNSVADMVLNPVLNHNEMNIPDFNTLVTKLSNLSYYPDLFYKAFASKTITKENIAYAIESFIACLNTSTTVPTQTSDSFPIDVFPEGNFNDVPLDTFSTLEGAGKFLFHNKYNCAKCHDPSNTGSYGNVSSPTQMFNIGLDEVYNDNGLGKITGKPGDMGLFKVPTLKNISLTAPYMHDGRFDNLSQVLDHYSHNIKPNKNLSSEFLNFDGTPKKLDISPVEKNALIAFLNTLKDNDFLTSPMYSDPFKK